MSKLEELIARLCPDGVEYKAIGDMVDYEQPSKYIVNSTKYDDSYSIPVLTAGQTFILGYTNETEGIYEASKENPVIIFDDFTAAFKWVDFRFKVKSSAMKILTVKSDLTTIRYVFHVMGFLNIQSDEHKRLWISNYSQIKLPVPPLEVQREIVHILDSFTLLTAELAAELAARQKQYEFYRDMLLTFDDVRAGGTNVECLEYQYVPLGSISTIARGASPRPIKNFITDSLEGVNWIKIGDVKAGSKYITETAERITREGAKKSRLVKKGDFVLSNSMSFGRPYIMKIDGCIHDGWLSISDFSHYFLPDFLYHLLNSAIYQSIMRQKASFGGAVQNLNSDIIKGILVPMVPLSEQQRIVDILDRFDALCNDITSGLPAEIEARKKQYEYYRDKLLTFKELKKEA